MAMTGGTAKLVKTGYAEYGNTSLPIRLYVYYRTSQNVAANESTVTVGMYVTTPNSNYGIGEWTDHYGSHVGRDTLTFNGTIPNFKGTYWIVENKSFTVTHNGDGTGETYIYWKWGVNSSWGQFQNPWGSFKISLPTIARKSTVSCPDSGTMKSNVVINIGRKSTTAFTHTLKYTFGGTTATIASGVNANTYTWAVPDLAAKCNNAKSGTCTITCETYSGSALVGTTTDTMVLNVPVATTPTFWSFETEKQIDTAQMGSKFRIHVGVHKLSENFTHALSYSFGTKSGTIATGVANYYDWTVPDLAAYCNNADSGSCTITCVTYNGTAMVDSVKKDLQLTVPSASVPTLSASTVTMGNDLTIYTNRKSANFTHKITYSFNGATGILDTDATTSYAWKPVPLDLAKKIPSKPSGSGTITCVTYNGTATVGTESVSFTATVPNNITTQPNVSKFTLTASGGVPSTFSGLYIQGKTGVTADYTASSAYSNISSYKMTVDGKTYSGDPATSGVFSTSGSKTIKGTVTDARGYYTEKTNTITVIPYSKPTIVSHSGERAVVCERCTSDGTPSDSGMFLKIKVGRDYYKVMSGETQKNFCTLGYRHKASAATSYSSDVILINAEDTFDEVDCDPISGVVESLSTSYDVQIFVEDTIGERNEYTFRIPTAGTDFSLREGGSGAAFGKYAEIENGVEFEWDVYGRVYGLGRLSHIAEWTNVDELRVFGAYAIPSNAVAETLTGLPIAKAGRFIVSSANGSGVVDGDGVIYIMQKYIPYFAEVEYMRLITGESRTWTATPWRKIQFEEV